jgi:hypothetical protein
MAPISYRRHRFPPVVIQRAVWLYLRFTLSYRDVEESVQRSPALASREGGIGGAGAFSRLLGQPQEIGAATSARVRKTVSASGKGMLPTK